MPTIHADDPRAIALTTAIRAGQFETLQRHLREHPELAAASIVDARGVSRSLLHVVADWPGHFPNAARCVAVLVAAGANPNVRLVPAPPAPPGETPLHWAASSDDVDVVDALLDGGADIEAPGAPFTGGTAMSNAVVFAQWRAERRLLDRGASTTLWQAAALGVIDRVQLALHGAPPPSAEAITNAVWHACRGGQHAVAVLLAERGGDVNWIGHDHKSPLDVAYESGNRELVSWLQSAGAIRPTAR